MTFPSTHSFYVTLLSQDDKEEFPHNQSASFKNRLPRPIRFVGSDWQVGLVHLSIPNVPLVARDLLGDVESVLYVRWHVRLLNPRDNRYYHYRQEFNQVGFHMTQSDLLTTGQQFSKPSCIAMNEHWPTAPRRKPNWPRTMAPSCTLASSGRRTGICS